LPATTRNHRTIRRPCALCGGAREDEDLDVAPAFG